MAALPRPFWDRPAPWAEQTKREKAKARKQARSECRYEIEAVAFVKNLLAREDNADSLASQAAWEQHVQTYIMGESLAFADRVTEGEHDFMYDARGRALGALRTHYHVSLRWRPERLPTPGRIIKYFYSKFLGRVVAAPKPSKSGEPVEFAKRYQVEERERQEPGKPGRPAQWAWYDAARKKWQEATREATGRMLERLLGRLRPGCK